MQQPRLNYDWHLRRLLAERGIFATTGLGPLLAERGINLSEAQVYRLVTGTPERLSLRTLAAQDCGNTARREGTLTAASGNQAR